ncbi:MAG: prepilin-type N-terminal cleavage/methylation domain-containing protein [Myxococcales bacterium]|nr:prepilin-type N-terminal cleavage/methylation domain-containing protein [Myxococcales bacterium]
MTPRADSGYSSDVVGGSTRAKGSQGFTLIELMVTIAIIGVMASIALPTYTNFVMQSKSSEGLTDLGMLFKGAAAYWESPFSGQGLGASGVGHCIVLEPNHALHPPPNFTGEKQIYDFSTVPEFKALGFTKSDPGYFSYTWGAVAGDDRTFANQCGIGDGFVYGFMAAADLDGDGKLGGYHMMVVSIDGQLSKNVGWGPVWPTFFGDAAVNCPICVDNID